MPLSREDVAGPVGKRQEGRRKIEEGGRLLSSFFFFILASAGGCAGLGGQEEIDLPGRLRLPPLVWCSREPDGSREVRNFLGLLYHQVSERARLSADLSAVPGTAQAGGREPPGPDDVVSRRSLDVLWPVYHAGSILRADGRRTVTRRFVPFFWMRRQSEKSGAGADYTQLRLNVLGIVLSLRSDNYGRGMKEADFLWPLGHYFFGERQLSGRPREIAQTLHFLPFLRLERTWPLEEERTGLALPGGGGVRETGLPPDRPPDRVRLRLLQPLFGYERDTAPRMKRAFLLGGTYTGQAGYRRAWGLVSCERGPSTDADFGLLWQLLLVVRRWGAAELVRTGERPERPSDLWRATKWLFHGSPGRLVRFTPLFNYESDWASDTKRISILLGLCSYERDGPDRRGRFLWLFRWGRRRRRTAAGERAARPPEWDR